MANDHNIQWWYDNGMLTPIGSAMRKMATAMIKQEIRDGHKNPFGLFVMCDHLTFGDQRGL